MSQLNEFRKLAGLPVLEEEGTGLSDITTTVKPEATPTCEVPREVRSALKQAVAHEAKLGEEATEKGQQQEAYFRNTASAFLGELDAMLDGTTEGHKRAVQHMTSALQSIVHLIPDVVVKYLAGNSSEWLNTEEINKEGLRKNLRSYWEDSKAGQ